MSESPLLTVKCCCKSRRVGATTSCGTEFFREAFVFGTVPVCRAPPPPPLAFAAVFWEWLLGPIDTDDEDDAADWDDEGMPPLASVDWAFSRLLLLEPGACWCPDSLLLPWTMIAARNTGRKRSCKVGERVIRVVHLIVFRLVLNWKASFDK